MGIANGANFHTLVTLLEVLGNAHPSTNYSMASYGFGSSTPEGKKEMKKLSY